MRKSINIALRIVCPVHLFGHVIFINMAALGEIEENLADNFGMLRWCDLAIVRQSAGVP